MGSRRQLHREPEAMPHHIPYPRRPYCRIDEIEHADKSYQKGNRSEYRKHHESLSQLQNFKFQQHVFTAIPTVQYFNAGEQEGRNVHHRRNRGDTCHICYLRKHDSRQERSRWKRRQTQNSAAKRFWRGKRASTCKPYANTGSSKWRNICASANKILITSRTICNSPVVFFTRIHSRKPTIFNRGMNANVLRFDRSICI